MQRDRELIKLAEDIISWAFLWNTENKVGEFAKRYSDFLNKKGMSELKAKHFEIAEWRIKQMFTKSK